MKRLNIGVVGATGVVGEVFLRILEQKNFPIASLRLFASDASKGQTRKCQNQEWPIQVLEENCFRGLDLVFFSSGDDISKIWAPKAIADGAWAVDNSAAFRMDNAYPLVVPEVNGDLLANYKTPTIVANPNCSTIQLVVALNPLYKKFGITRVHVASYQATSGAGKNGIEELLKQTQIYINGEEPPAGPTFPETIAFNCIPQIGSFTSDGFCTEEVKIMTESCKILRAPELKVSAFTVRVPVTNVHAEAVWVTLDKKASLTDVVNCLELGDGLVLQKPSEKPPYITQAKATNTDPVYIGRIHQDRHDSQTFLLWIVADNVRKGAALNGVQIAEQIFDIK